MKDASDRGEVASFEDIGRLIGERWRNIEPDDLAKYKELAEADTTRYKKEVDQFYKDELSLMCLGRTSDDPGSKGPADQGVDSQGKTSGELLSATPPKVSSSAAALPNVNSQATNLSQQQMPMGASGQGSSVAGMVNQVNSFIPGGMPLNPGMSMPSNDDQIFQLLLQHYQQTSPASSVPNESVMQLILNLKTTFQQRQQKLTEELNTLQLKSSLLDNMLAKEMSNLQGKSAEVAAPFAPAGHGQANLQQLGQLSQLLQTQTTAATASAETGTAGLANQLPTNSQSFASMLAPAPSMLAPAPSNMQELLFNNNNQASLSQILSAPSSGMNDPNRNNNFNIAGNTGVNVQDMLQNLMNGGK